MWYLICCCFYYSFGMIPRVRIYMPHSSAVVLQTPVYVAGPRRSRQLRAVAWSTEEFTSTRCRCVYTAAVTSCGRRAMHTRTSCSFKKQSDTYRRSSHDSPCSLFVGHLGVRKHILIETKHFDTKPAGPTVQHVSDGRAPKQNTCLSGQVLKAAHI